MSKNLIIIGGGGHSKVVLETVSLLDYEICAILDDDQKKWGKEIKNIPVLGGINWLTQNYKEHELIIAIGNNEVRKSVAEKITSLINPNWATLLHPKSWIASNVKIQEGSVVCAGVIIQPDTKIGKHCIINTGANIDHDCDIDNYVHVGPGAILAGEIEVGAMALIGTGANVIPRIRVGEKAVVGAGATVVKNVGESDIVVGVPAKSRKKI